MLPPIALLAIAFAAGIAAREALGLPVWPLAALLVVSTIGLWLAWRRGRFFGMATLAHALVLGGMGAATAWPVAPPGLVDAAPATVNARVLDEPEQSFGQTHLLVEVEELRRADRARDASGRVRLKLPGAPVEPLLPGDGVRFHATLKEPRGFAEPDAPDPERRAAARGVTAVAGLPSSPSLARLDEPSAPSLRRAIAAWRRRLLTSVASHLQGERRALVESLVLGDRADVSQELDAAFRVAGVSHVLSVSGLHLAIAAFLFFVGLRRLLLRIEPLARRWSVRRVAALAALPATVIYTVLTGAQVATVRACVVAWIYLLGAVLERPPTAWAALGVAALVILVASPLALYDPSFQLSFAAALGSAALVPRLVGGRLAGKGLARRLGRLVLGILATSLAATLATAPIAAWHFAQVAPAGLVSNLVVVPLAELWVLPVGLVACLFSSLWPASWWSGPVRFLFALAGWGAEAMARAVRFFASLPGAEVASHVPAPTLLEAAAWYGALVALAARGRRGWRVAACFLTLLAGSIGARVLLPRLAPALTLTFLDVGHGDACLVELPDGKTLLVDGGGSFDPSFDPGTQVIAPWLERRGVRRIDVVVLTHPHPDHANGLAAVVARFSVGEVWTNGAPSELPGLLRLEAEAARRGVPVVRPHALDGGGARVEVLHPLLDGLVKVSPVWSENDGSIVLRVSYAGRAALLAGDVEARAERRLTDGAAPDLLKADVLKAPHHGSRTSSTPAFVDRVAPQVVVFSVGAANRWGFPSPEVDARWKAHGARTYRTDRDGAITVRVTASGSLHVATARRH